MPGVWGKEVKGLGFRKRGSAFSKLSDFAGPLALGYFVLTVSELGACFYEASQDLQVSSK